MLAILEWKWAILYGYLFDSWLNFQITSKQVSNTKCHTGDVASLCQFHILINAYDKAQNDFPPSSTPSTYISLPPSTILLNPGWHYDKCIIDMRYSGLMNVFFSEYLNWRLCERTGSVARDHTVCLLGCTCVWFLQIVCYSAVEIDLFRLIYFSLSLS